MEVYIEPSIEKWKALCLRPRLELEFLDGAVKNVLNRVRQSGDAALKELTLQYDKVNIDQLKVTEGELKHAAAHIPYPLKSAIKVAAANIYSFHNAQKREILKVETMPGVTCWRKAIGIDSIGIYIPGGSAPLFSTVLMLAIPANLAGCTEIILCTPPGNDGNINPAILYAAHTTGITQVFKVGGAQAIGAMAYGTQTIPPVNKIFGPGNQYVTKAKQLVNQEGIAIDMPAGPSELLVIADENTDEEFAAADLLSQAEHGTDSQVVLVSSNESKVYTILSAIDRQVQKLPRIEIAKEALKKSLAIVFNSKKTILDFVNQYAPEHLIINTADCDVMLEDIRNSGSVFLGPFSPESAGDYASGTNHTLPTNGYAKAYGGVSLESFTKYMTIQKLTRQGIEALGPVIERMALAEQLQAHANAARIRYDS